jgi:HD-GYP domain-containing protein (c-di-GMP phosphodiesterase class II)
MAVLRQISNVSGLLVLCTELGSRLALCKYAAEQQAYDSTVSALCQAVETKDLYTRGHSERVSLGSVLIARQLGMREDRVGAIRYAGMLHDVGKLGVPTRVLQKSGQLTQDEFDAIKLHPVRGFEMLRGIDFLNEALAGIIHHHERLDGRGYPMGLKGADIPEFARIIAVADALDAMTSTRSYRAAKSVEEALSEIRASAGTQFDLVMVEAVDLAIARHGWSAHRRDDDHEKPVGIASMGEVLLADDHDERLIDGGRHL